MNQHHLNQLSIWLVLGIVLMGLCLGKKTAEKSNEITAISEPLNSLAIKGCIITIDAMVCQKGIDTGHGRIEKRKTYIIDVNAAQKELLSAKKGKKLNNIVMIDSTREETCG